MAIDPVCGMQVDTERARFNAEHDGQAYYFCWRGCMLDSQEDPEQYLHPEYAPSGMDTPMTGMES
jgi:P-type Cu+ transporter